MLPRHVHPLGHVRRRPVPPLYSWCVCHPQDVTRFSSPDPDAHTHAIVCQLGQGRMELAWSLRWALE